MMFIIFSRSDMKGFKMFKFIWSILCVLLFLSASSCFAAYMDKSYGGSGLCSKTDYSSTYCKQRLGGVVAGFIAAVLYIVDAVLHRPEK